MPYFLDPGRMLRRLSDLRATRISRDLSKGNTLHYWYHESLKSWVTEEKQKILLVQAQYISVHQMEHFGLEMTRFISARRPTVFLLSSFSSPESRTAFGDIQPEQVLRQLCIQALEKISVPQPLSFLAAILERFQAANSCDDWIKVMGLITKHVTDLYVVLDLGVVHVQHAEVLRTAFRTLLCEASSRGCLKVMLMSCRKLGPAVDTTDIIISPTGNSRLRLKSDLLSVQKSLTSMLERNDAVATKASNATAVATAIRTVSEAPMTTTPGNP